MINFVVSVEVVMNQAREAYYQSEMLVSGFSFNSFGTQPFEIYF